MSTKEKPKSISEEFEQTTEARKKAGEGLEVGQTYYVINAKWYRAWKDYVKHKDDDEELPEERPDRIDNADLLEKTKSDDGVLQLRIGIQERYDYDLVHEEEWKLLYSWYGGGPPIPRKVISESNNKIKRVEVHLLHLEILIAKDDGQPKEKTSKLVNVSKTMKLSDFILYIAKLYEIKAGTECRAWNYDTPVTASVLSDPDSSLSDEQLVYGQKILLEKKKKDGAWPRDTTKLAKKGKDKESDNVPAFPRGQCGLYNLGNTCFMNSALQCLSNTPVLNDYFITANYKNDINKNNPLGMKGNVAESFGTLLKAMWSGENEVVTPKRFKHVLGKWAPQFEGFAQHDCQEFLGTLLDGLHEDLNKISTKPYIELKEADGRPDQEVALEAWESHLKRNQSTIVDLFQGQLKSTVKCPDCGKISVTFDPFMYLSLPLVQEKEIWKEITVLKEKESDTPMKYAVRVPKQGQIYELKEALAEVSGLDPDRIALSYLQQQRIMPFYKNNQPITNINPDELLIAYEIPNNPSPELIHTKVVHRRKRTRPPYFSSHELFGVSFMIFFVPHETTGRQLYKMVWDRCKRFIKYQSNDDSNSSSSESDDEPENQANGDKMDIESPTKGSKANGTSGTDAMDIDDDPKSEESLSDSSVEQELELDYSKLPFKLALVATAGLNCSRCGTTCTGCHLKANDKPISLPRKEKSITIAIDWEPHILDNYYDDEEALSVKVDKTVTAKRKMESNRGGMSLYDCLGLFTTQEKLGPHDPWYCPKCKEHKQAYKKFDIWKLPKVLVVHLKRFQYTKFSREKLNFAVDFPLEGLDLSPYVINSEEKGIKYDLYGVANHMGGMGGGHYTAYCKNPTSRKWYHFNDSSVSSLSEASKVKTPAAYVLFYKRADMDDNTHKEVEPEKPSQANGKDPKSSSSDKKADATVSKDKDKTSKKDKKKDKEK